MGIFDLMLIMAGMCGPIMILGGIGLLYKGAISLSERSQAEALTIEFRRMFKITTHYPALGLFVIGLTFSVVSLSYSGGDIVRPLQIEAELSSSGISPITVVGTPYHNWESTCRVTAGKFSFEMRPVIGPVELQFVADGRKPYKSVIEPQDFKRGHVKLVGINLVPEGVQ